MRVPRLRRDAGAGQEGQGVFLRRRSTPAHGFGLERFEYVAVGGDSVLLRIAGHWRGERPEAASLEVRAGGQTHRYEPLPGGTGSEAQAWSVGFAVPGQVVVPGSRYALRANGHWVPLEDPVDGSAPRSPAAAITHEDAAEAQRERDRALSELQAQGELERMGAALAEAQAEAHRLQTELSQARPEAAARAAEVESLQGQLQGIRGDLETVRAEAESLRQAIVAAQSERDHALAMSERNETAVTALHRKANELAKDLEERDGKITELESQLETARGEGAAATKELEPLRQRTAELESELAPLKSSLEATAAERDQLLVSLRELRTAWSEEVEPKLAEMRRLESDLDIERTARAQLYEETRKLHGLQTQHQEQISAIRTELEQAHAAIENYSSDREAREAELERIRAALAETEQSRQEIESRISQAEETARTAAASEEQAKAEAATAVDHAKSEAATAMERARAEAVAAASTVEERDQELESLRQEHDRDLESLRQELDAVRRQLDEERQGQQRMRDEITALEDRLVGAREALRRGVGGRVWGAEA
ncbi:MAG: hypothetical protein E6G00_00255 [Actinobacteria bacterium]|nr:MAG: hypothetical protein E6G29_00160 [Actinomycetota bacterium]TMM14585.1 MAG: hypothetical protein E6G00_00255 [Actinomycetota bacterium]